MINQPPPGHTKQKGGNTAKTDDKHHRNWRKAVEFPSKSAPPV